jgi:poly(3-hydroxybutyrate) depolymerase
MLAIMPHLVSAPGRDILSGVDALVKDGIADPDHLTIGGYSYGGYMTNWLITQTTRFKAAVTGAGAVEHAANWGNDDLTWDDAWYLSGTPWEKPELYQDEAALFQMNKVTTPTHIVGGNADNRVSYFECAARAAGVSGRESSAGQEPVAWIHQGSGGVEVAAAVWAEVAAPHQAKTAFSDSSDACWRANELHRATGVASDEL